MEQKTQCQRTWKMLRHSLLCLLWSLLVRFAFRNPRPLKPMGKSEARDQVGKYLNKTGHMQVTGTWWETFESVVGGGWCHFEAALNYLWRTVVFRGGFWGQTENKCYFYLQEREEGESRELQTGQPHLNPGISCNSFLSYLMKSKGLHKGSMCQDLPY